MSFVGEFLPGHMSGTLSDHTLCYRSAIVLLSSCLQYDDIMLSLCSHAAVSPPYDAPAHRRWGGALFRCVAMGGACEVTPGAKRTELSYSLPRSLLASPLDASSTASHEDTPFVRGPPLV